MTSPPGVRSSLGQPSPTQKHLTTIAKESFPVDDLVPLPGFIWLDRLRHIRCSDLRRRDVNGTGSVRNTDTNGGGTLLSGAIEESM
jgi:hypothetical protein